MYDMVCTHTHIHAISLDDGRRRVRVPVTPVACYVCIQKKVRNKEVGWDHYTVYHNDLRMVSSGRDGDIDRHGNQLARSLFFFIYMSIHLVFTSVISRDIACESGVARDAHVRLVMNHYCTCCTINVEHRRDNRTCFLSGGRGHERNWKVRLR